MTTCDKFSLSDFKRSKNETKKCLAEVVKLRKKVVKKGDYYHQSVVFIYNLHLIIAPIFEYIYSFIRFKEFEQALKSIAVDSLEDFEVKYVKCYCPMLSTKV